MIPESRLRIVNPKPSEGECVVYWMISTRRSTWNHGLDHSINLAKERNLPLVVVEPLAIAHEYANDRIHAFVIQGMMDNKKAFEDSPVTYVPYVETKHNEARGLLEKWMEHATVLVIDDFPVYFPRRVIEIASEIDKCEVHCVDSNGFLAMDQGREFTTAYSFRRHVHKTILQSMSEFPAPDPLSSTHGMKKFPVEKVESIFKESDTPITPYEFIWRICEGTDVGQKALSVLKIDHDVPPVPHTQGGSVSARARWQEFLTDRLNSYSENRNEPELNGSSGLSPYLHFGHISCHEILSDIFEKYNWNTSEITLLTMAGGLVGGDFHPDVESFLDQIITWRDLRIHPLRCSQESPFVRIYTRVGSKTLREHENDPRPYIYSFEEFENAETHDELWNAAQNQLRRDGMIHNYLRMLWGKKILEWSPTLRKRWSTWSY